MTSVGEILRTERTNQGLEVTEIASKLCIKERYVCAMEQDELNDLPNVFFYKSFVRQYAAIVGLDYARLQTHVEALVPREEAPAPPPPVSRLAATLRACARFLHLAEPGAPQLQ